MTERAELQVKREKKGSGAMREALFQTITEFIQKLYRGENPVFLHKPVFLGKEKEYLADCVDSTYVSYVGKYVTRFEEMTAAYTGAHHAVAAVNGTAALQVALEVAGVQPGDEVITQPLTFVATANAISHCGAEPVFVDVDMETLGMSPESLERWLKENTKKGSSKRTINKSTGRTLSAVVPVHTFGFPCRIDGIVEIANEYKIPVIEDAAESLGSFYKKRHTGTFGLAGILSYNGNKTVTTGGGGMILTDDGEFAGKARHITTTGKLPVPYEYVHDITAYNYRMTNVNAALGVAQMENLDRILGNKKETAEQYREFFKDKKIRYFTEPENASSNYWLNTLLLRDREERDAFLEYTNKNGVLTRAAWRLMTHLPMYGKCRKDSLKNAEELEGRIVNIPSGYRK